ncbi:MAG: mobile mystery protein B [Pseudomonadota bacterium]
MPVFREIEGATPIHDASGLKIKITSLEQLYDAEAQNIAKAMLKYLAGKPSRRSASFDVSWSLKLHREMFYDVWKWAGQIRTSNLNMGVSVYQIQEELLKLFADLKCWQDTGMDLLEQAVRLHHRAVSIHPFVNGNGRWSRMLGNIWLKQNNNSPTLWPAEMNRESSIRLDYIKAVREADKGNITPLLEMHRKFEQDVYGSGKRWY